MTIQSASGVGAQKNDSDRWSSAVLPGMCALGSLTALYAVKNHYSSPSQSNDGSSDDLRSSGAGHAHLPRLQSVEVERRCLADPSRLLGGINKHPRFRDYFNAQADKQIILPPISIDQHYQVFKPFGTTGNTFKAFKLGDALNLDLEAIGYILLVHPNSAQYSQVALPINAAEWLDHEVLPESIDAKKNQVTAGPWLKHFGDEFFFIFEHNNALNIFQNRPSYDGFPLVRMRFSHTESPPLSDAPPITEVEHLHSCLERFCHKNITATQTLNVNMERMQQKIEPPILENIKQQFFSALNELARTPESAIGIALEQWNKNQGSVDESDTSLPMNDDRLDDLLDDLVKLPRTPDSVMMFPSSEHSDHGMGPAIKRTLTDEKPAGREGAGVVANVVAKSVRFKD